MFEEAGFDYILGCYIKGYITTFQLYWWKNTSGALCQARAGTWVEPPTFHKLDSFLTCKEFNVPDGIQTHSDEGQVILSQGL